MKKIKYILLILAIVAFIAVIIAGLIYVKETNNEINNLKEQIKKINYSGIIEKSKVNEDTENLNDTENIQNSTNNIVEYSAYENDMNLSIALVNFLRLLNEKDLTEKSSLKLGSYLVNEVKVDEADMSNKDCGIKLGNNNIFEIYMGYGASHYGMYETKNNKLICQSAFLFAEVGGVKGTNVVFTFDIINNNTLKLENIEINDKINDNDKLVYEEGFTKGMTYSIK